MKGPRLTYELEAALLTLVGDGGRHPDPGIRSLALDALPLLRTLNVTWLDQVTVIHTELDDVPFVVADWTGE